jgi:hypothetical protein
MANNFPNLRPTLNLDMVNGIYVDPRVTFTRAGTRTYYGQEVVKAEENLLLQSQTFQTTWSQAGAVVTADTQVAPDGTTTADTLTLSVALSTHLVSQVSSSTAGTQRTVSVFVKQGTHTFVQIAFNTDNQAFGNFDVTTGAGAVGSVGSAVSASIVDAGNGWFRCVMTTSSATAGTTVVIYGVSSSTAVRAESWLTLGTETLFLWGAQLEQRSSVTAYTATTTQPITRYQRLLKTAAANEWPREFDPVTGECLGRSVWESRTNLLLRSEEFDNAYWTKVAVTVSPNQIIAPDGTLTVDKLISTAVSGFHNISRSSGTRVASTAYTYSFFAKAAEIGFCSPNFSSGLTGTALSAVINLTTGAATSVTAGLTVRTVFVGNGFYRISITATGDANTTAFNATINTTDAAGNLSHTGDGTSGIYIWGAQLEAGAFATPYIPTVASQVTRLADSAVMTGVNFSSWFNPEQGTLVLEGAGVGTSSAIVTLAEDASANNRFQISVGPSGVSANILFAAAGGPTQASFNGTPTTLNKVAGSYLFNDYKACLNGGTVGTDTVALVPVVNNLRIGQTVGTTFSGYYRRVTYYSQASTAANVQAITR